MHSTPCAPANTPWHTTHAAGVEQLAGSITGWEQLYDQTSPGRFQGALTEMLLGRAQVFAESSSHALVQTCKTWPQAVWFGIPGQERQTGRIEGAAIEQGMLAIRTGEQDFQLRTPDDFVFLGVVVEIPLLQEYLQTQGANAPKGWLEQRVLAVQAPALHALRQTLNHLLGSAAHAPAALAQAARTQLQDEVFSGITAVLTAGQAGERDSVSAQHARRTMRRVREYLQAHDDHCITVHELCTAVGASRRALQDCFRKSLDLGPKEYLRAVALNAARRELQRPDSACQSVGDVASRYGFWHLSQFATDYRKLFGELPSQTLRERNRADF